MQRICPHCSTRSIPIAGLLLGVYECSNCRHRVRVNRAASFLFSILIIVVTVATSYMVLSMFGIFAVIIWFAFPIGAISYIKARFCPLTVLPHKTGAGDGY
jgi:uncharacterized protein (DUF983 family)